MEENQLNINHEKIKFWKSTKKQGVYRNAQIFNLKL